MPRFWLKTSVLSVTSIALPSTPMSCLASYYAGYWPQDSDRMPYLSQIACPATPKRPPGIAAGFCYYDKILVALIGCPSTPTAALLFH